MDGALRAWTRGRVMVAAAIAGLGELPDFPRFACGLTDPDTFFPPSGGLNAAITEEAKDVCLGCPEREACLDWALEHDEWGVWGGTTDKERARIRKGLSAQETRTCKVCGDPFLLHIGRGAPPQRCRSCREGRRHVRAV